MNFILHLLANTFEVSKTGKVGISTNAGLTLSVTQDLPEILYYKFTPINESLITESKKEIIIDKEIEGYNQIGIEDSVYSGEFAVIGIGSTTTFTYNSLTTRPERPSYSEAEVFIRIYHRF